MPLLFKRKENSQNANQTWLGLNLSANHKKLLWSVTSLPVGIGDDEVVPNTIEGQVDLLLENYDVFEFMDRDVFDLGRQTYPKVSNFCTLLNEKGANLDYTFKALDRGWLSPEGVFVGCREGDHRSLMLYTLGKTVDEVKSEGWVVVQQEFYNALDFDGNVTQEQQETLNLMGFDGAQRSAIPEFTQHFEEMRLGFVSANTNFLAPVPVEEAKALITNIDAAVRKIERDMRSLGGFGAEFLMAMGPDFTDDHFKTANDMALAALEARLLPTS